MFNFFSEVKKGVKDYTLNSGFNMVNISNHILYVEGHKGIAFFSNEIISFKVDGGRLSVYGQDLKFCELTDNTLKISGKIEKIEAL